MRRQDARTIHFDEETLAWLRGARPDLFNAYDDSDLRARIEALEARPWGVIGHDDTRVLERLEALEARADESRAALLAEKEALRAANDRAIQAVTERDRRIADLEARAPETVERVIEVPGPERVVEKIVEVPVEVPVDSGPAYAGTMVTEDAIARARAELTSLLFWEGEDRVAAKTPLGWESEQNRLYSRLQGSKEGLWPWSDDENARLAELNTIASWVASVRAEAQARIRALRMANPDIIRAVAEQIKEGWP